LEEVHSKVYSTSGDVLTSAVYSDFTILSAAAYGFVRHLLH